MNKEMIQKYLEASRLTGVPAAELREMEATLSGFNEYCEKQERQRQERARLYLAGPYGEAKL